MKWGGNTPELDSDTFWPTILIWYVNRSMLKIILKILIIHDNLRCCENCLAVIDHNIVTSHSIQYAYTITLTYHLHFQKSLYHTHSWHAEQLLFSRLCSKVTLSLSHSFTLSSTLLLYIQLSQNSIKSWGTQNVTLNTGRTIPKFFSDHRF